MSLNKHKFHIDFYLEKEFSIIPIPLPIEGHDFKDGKRPAFPWQAYTKRQASIEEIETWFFNVKSPPNIGIITGRISNLAVLDLDDKKSAIELIHAMPILDNTLTVETSKGFHVYLRPDVNAVTRTFRLNDKLHHIRQEGGYVVAPPSLHISGHEYRFLDMDIELLDVPIADLYNTIESLGGFSQERDRELRSIDWASELWEPTPEGSRNTRAAQLCGLLINKFPYDPGFVMGCMNAWNVTTCKPPMSTEEITNLVRGEIRRYAEL